MIPCSCCGYQFPESKLQQRPAGRFCAICLAIGGSVISENPNAFGEAKHFIPALGYATNKLLDAISTRAAADELPGASPAPAPDAGLSAFMVFDAEHTLIDVQDDKGTPIDLAEARFSPVDGTEFKKLAVTLPLK